MAYRFRGEDDFKVDSKGRVSIPAAFRRVLESADPDWQEGKPARFILVYGGATRNYLEGFPIEVMKEVEDKIVKHPRGSAKRKAMERLYTAQSVELTVDDTGRIVLPAKVRKKIDIKNKAVFVASGDTFEIWEPATYEASTLQADEEGFDPDKDASVYLEGDL